jgi:uncharacterized Zn finger protein (UPF0148 family)
VTNNVRADRREHMLGRRCQNCRTAVVLITRYPGPVFLECPICQLLRDEPAGERLELSSGGLTP